MVYIQCTENIYQKRLAREHKCWNRAESESVTDNSKGNSSLLLIRLLECVSSTWDRSASLGIFSILNRGQADKAWGGNVNTLTRFLRPLTHFSPWSKARSHSRGQATALSTSTTIDMFTLPTCLASRRSRSLDCRSSLISRGWRQVSASGWSIAEVKFELKNFSRSGTRRSGRRSQSHPKEMLEFGNSRSHCCCQWFFWESLTSC